MHVDYVCGFKSTKIPTVSPKLRSSRQRIESSLWEVGRRIGREKREGGMGISLRQRKAKTSFYIWFSVVGQHGVKPKPLGVTQQLLQRCLEFSVT